MNLKIEKKDIEKAKKEFKKTGDGKRGPFYNKTQEWKFNLEISLFKNAVWQGYLDACRTFHGIKNTAEKRNAFDNLAASLFDYFRNENTSFEHNNWCNKFIEDLLEYNNYNARYGQAQKVVNMAFKYLYCCEGAEEYSEKFKKCHMPLDQYTLAWLCSEGKILYLEWSWFNPDTYDEASNAAKKILKTNILDKELVIWEKYKDRVVNLRELEEKNKK